MKRLQLISWGLLCLAIFSSAQQCYSQTGSPLDPTMYKQCNASASANPGACCNIGNGDICTEFGLCLRQRDVVGTFYQDGCTDSSNDEVKCPQFCPGKQNKPWAVQSCGDSDRPGTWCCKQVQSDGNCCSNASAVITTNIGRLVLPTRTITAMTSTTSMPLGENITTTAITTTTAAAFAGGPQPSTCPKDVSAATSAGVGASLGIALLAALGTLFWRERTRPKGFPDVFPETRHSPDLLLAMSRRSSGRLQTSPSSREELDGLRDAASHSELSGEGVGIAFPGIAHIGLERRLSSGRETLQGSEQSFGSVRGASPLGGRQDALREYEQSSAPTLGGLDRSASGGSEVRQNTHPFRYAAPVSAPISSNSSGRLDVSSRVEQNPKIVGEVSSTKQTGLGIYPNPQSMGGPIEEQKFLRPYELQS